MSLSRRRIKKLEAKRSKVKAVPDELLERYYELLENEQAELEGRPKPHPDPPTEQELKAYYMALEDYQAELEGRPKPHPDPPDEDYGDS